MTITAVPVYCQEGMLNRVEAAVRCYDPCLSCSTHPLGKVGKVIERRYQRGQVLDGIE